MTLVSSPFCKKKKTLMASKWFDVQHVAPDYTFPQENRPGQLPFPTWNRLPVINLQNPSRNDTIKEIIDASQTYGFFQVCVFVFVCILLFFLMMMIMMIMIMKVINHGVPKKISNDTIEVLREYFNMSSEEKKCGVENGWNYMESTDFSSKDGIHLWRESIKHPCYPLPESMQSWPQKPTQYREIVSTYLEKIRYLSSTILELIGEGLGLEAGYLKEISQVQLLVGNYYPPCPDPSLTLGLLKHCDPSLITILLQEDVSGLQVLLDDDKWIVVSSIPDAFVVNIGNQLQVISNGKLRSLEHRAVTNKDKGRISIASFVNPSPNSTIEPAKVLVDEMNPPLYKPFLYKDFVYTPNVFDLPPTQASAQEPTGPKP